MEQGLLALSSVLGSKCVVRGAFVGLTLGVLTSCGSARERSETLAETMSLEETRISTEFRVDHPDYRDHFPWGDLQFASGPSGYLAVYPLADDPDSNQRKLDAVATRITPLGEIVDPTGILLGSGSEVRAVFAGTHWVVLFTDVDTLRCGRMLEDGTLLDPGGKPLGDRSFVVAMTYDGSNVFALDTDGRALMLAPDCTAVGAPINVTTQPPYGGATLSLAFDGTNFLVGYTSSALGSPDRFAVQQVSTAGALVGAPIVVETASWVRTDWDTEGYVGVKGKVASEPGSTLVTYSPLQWDANARIAVPDAPRYRALGGDRTLGDVHTVAELPGQVVDAVAVNDGFVLLGYSGQTSVLVKVRPDGAELARHTSLPRFEDFWNWRPILASRETDVVVARQHVIWRLTSDLSLASGPTVALKRAADQRHPSVASAGDLRLVVWDNGAYGSRVSLSGAILDPSPLRLHSRPGELVSGSVATDGRDFLVGVRRVFESSYSIEAKRVLRDGTVDARSITVSPNDGSAPSIASDGADYLVVWLGWPRVLGRRVSSAGELLDSSPIVVAPDDVGSVAAAYDGSEYVVAFGPGDLWEEQGIIGIARLTPDGVVASVESTPLAGRVKGLTFAGGRGLLTYFPPTPSTTLMVARLVRRGESWEITSTALNDSALVSPVPVAWDGANFWVAWQDTRRGPLGPFNGGERHALDVYAARFAPDGALLDPTGILLAEGVLSSEGRTPDVALAAEREGVLAAYVAWDPSHGFRALRVRARVLSSGGGGEGGAGGEGGGGEGGSGEGGTAGSAGTRGGLGGTAGDGDGAAGESGGAGGQSKGGDGSIAGAPDGGQNGGSAGTSPPGGGAAGSTGATAGTGDTDEGCTCSAVGSTATRGRFAMALLATGLALLFGRRRRQHGQAGAPQLIARS
jgi:hypothetical protein